MAEIRMEDLKPNSHQYQKEQERAAEEGRDIPEKNQEQQVPKPELNGSVKTRRRPLARRFLDIFLKDGASPKEIKEYLIEEVIVPAVLENIADVVSTAIEMRFFGSAKRRKRGSSSNGSRASYGSFFNDGNSGRRERIAKSTKEMSGREPLDDIIFESKRDAGLVLADMNAVLETYPQVTVADYLDILASYGISVKASHTDNKFGWTDLNGIEPVRARGGGYYLDLPREYPI